MARASSHQLNTWAGAWGATAAASSVTCRTDSSAVIAAIAGSGPLLNISGMSFKAGNDGTVADTVSALPAVFAARTSAGT